MSPKPCTTFLATIAIIFAACLLSFLPHRTTVAFHFTVLGYTNAGSSIQALLYMTNASATAYAFFPETEILTNGVWQYSAAQPKNEVISEVFPALSARTINVPGSVKSMAT